MSVLLIKGKARLGGVGVAPPNRHTCTNNVCSAARASPTTNQTAAGRSTWLFLMKQFTKHILPWCQHVHQVEPLQGRECEFLRISRVLSPGRSRKLCLTWGF